MDFFEYRAYFEQTLPTASICNSSHSNKTGKGSVLRVICCTINWNWAFLYHPLYGFNVPYILLSNSEGTRPINVTMYGHIGRIASHSRPQSIKCSYHRINNLEGHTVSTYKCMNCLKWNPQSLRNSFRAAAMSAAITIIHKPLPVILIAFQKQGSF